MPRTKSQSDIAAIKASAHVAEKAVLEVIAYLRSSNQSSSEAAKEVARTFLTQHGHVSPEGLIVAGGIRTAEPHFTGEGVLKPYTPIVIDIFPQSEATGFFADISRTVCIGDPPERLRAMFAAVHAAQQAAVALLHPGVPCVDIHGAAVAVFESAGYETRGTGAEFTYAEGFVHSIGHGLGVDVHESPGLGAASTDILQVGDVVTVEPGLYYKDIGGVRIEDLFVITETGYTQLTTIPVFLQV